MTSLPEQTSGLTLPDIGIAVGVDVVEVERVKNLQQRWGDRFSSRCLTSSERSACRDKAESTAARLAAKEACAKALGTGFTGFGWRDIEIVSDLLNKPSIRLRRGAKQRADDEGWRSISLSLTHSAGVAVAVVVALKTGKNA